MVWERIIAGPRGRVAAPLALWLHSPGLGDAAERLGLFSRYNSSLPRHLSELAICIVARAWKADLEWEIHSADAVKAGLPQAIVDSLAQDRSPRFADPAGRAVYRFTRELVEKRKIGNRTYEDAEAQLGRVGVIDLVGILGYYTLVSMTLQTFKP